jgi:hypothetical protein
MEAAKGDLAKKGQLMMEQKKLDQLVIHI